MKHKKTTWMDLQLAPRWIIPHIQWMEEAEVNGESVRYAVVRPELNPGLVGFVGFYADETNKEIARFFISRDVPNRFRRFFIAHEAMCVGHDEITACKESLVRELALVPKNIRTAYLRYRCAFYIRLVEFFKKRGELDTPIAKKVMVACEHIRTMIRRGTRMCK